MKRAKTGSRKHSQLGPSIRRFFLLGALGIVALFGLFGFFGDNGVLDMIRLKTMHHQIEAENQRLLEKQEELQQERNRLKDTQYVEYLARDRLGLLKPNEVFIILDKP